MTCSPELYKIVVQEGRLGVLDWQFKRQVVCLMWCNNPKLKFEEISNASVS